TRLRLLRGEVGPVLALADRLRLAPALAVALRDRALVPPMPSRAAADGAQTATAAIADRLAREAGRLSAFSLHPERIVPPIHYSAIEPVLLKGARAVWQGQPVWRSLRDLDLLIPGEAADEADRVLRRMGYAPLPDAPVRPLHHHATPLFG